MAAWQGGLRFDSAGAAAFNVVAIGIALVAVVLLVRRQIKHRPAPFWAWPICLAHVSFNGVYVPIGPVPVLVILAADALAARAEGTRVGSPHSDAQRV